MGLDNGGMSQSESDFYDRTNNYDHISSLKAKIEKLKIELGEKDEKNYFLEKEIRHLRDRLYVLGGGVIECTKCGWRTAIFDPRTTREK